MEVHVHLLVESGIHIIECLNLEELAASGVREFLFVATPLKIRGGTASPIRPYALVPEDCKLMSYDAVLLISFGGPEKREDVIPFLENVLRGRNVPYERLLEVAEHYYHFDGRSPINDQCRDLIRCCARRASNCPPTGVTGIGIPCWRIR